MKMFVLIIMWSVNLFPSQHLTLPNRVTIFNNYQNTMNFSLSCNLKSWDNYSLSGNHSDSYSCSNVEVRLYIKIVTELSEGNYVEKQYWLPYGGYYHFVIKRQSDQNSISYWDIEMEPSP